MSDYKPVPVEVAKQIANAYEKSVVIVLAFDHAHGRLHTTTYGYGPSEKAWAADGGEIAAKALGTLPGLAEFYENYRQHCCAASGHIQMKPERECSNCLVTALICENLSKPCCGKCMHQSIRCVAHPIQDSVNGSAG